MSIRPGNRVLATTEQPAPPGSRHVQPQPRAPHGHGHGDTDRQKEGRTEGCGLGRCPDCLPGSQTVSQKQLQGKPAANQRPKTNKNSVITAANLGNTCPVLTQHPGDPQPSPPHHTERKADPSCHQHPQPRHRSSGPGCPAGRGPQGAERAGSPTEPPDRVQGCKSEGRPCTHHPTAPGSRPAGRYV